MKTFVFTYDRYDTITTSQYLKGHEHFVLCHTEEQKKRFEDSGRVFGELIATGNQKGLAYNRNAALEMMRDGEWAVFWVDDLIETTCLENYFGMDHLTELGVTTENQPQLRKELKHPCDASLFYEISKSTISVAEQKGFPLCGFSLTDNPLFRNKHFSFWGLADGRCWLVKKTQLRFDIRAQLIDDTCFTAMNLKKFGGVVVNNWLLPNCKRYTGGAYGTMDERMEQKKAECSYLVEAYPEFIQFADKAGWPEGSHIKIRQTKIDINQQTLFG